MALTDPTVTLSPLPRAAVRALPRYVPGRRADGPQIARLASNESHYDPLPSVVGMVQGAARALNRYPEATSARLRDRLCAHLGLAPDQLTVGPGSVGVLHQLISAFCEPGDEVVYAWRSFEAYPLLCRLAGATPVPVPLRTDEHHDLDAMRAAITGHTRVVLLCTPNNPTGTSISAAALAQFLAEVPAHVLVVVDEAYQEYDGPSAALPLLASHPNLALLRTFSKAYGLAGLRIGYAAATAPVADAIGATGLPFAVTELAQQAATSSLEAADELKHRVVQVAAERDRMIATLRARGWRTPDSRGNFVWLRTGADEDDAVMARLSAAGILARPYPGDGVRVTVADVAANERVLAALGSPTHGSDGPR